MKAKLSFAVKCENRWTIELYMQSFPNCSTSCYLSEKSEICQKLTVLPILKTQRQPKNETFESRVQIMHSSGAKDFALRQGISKFAAHFATRMVPGFRDSWLCCKLIFQLWITQLFYSGLCGWHGTCGHIYTQRSNLLCWLSHVCPRRSIRRVCQKKLEKNYRKKDRKSSRPYSGAWTSGYKSGMLVHQTYLQCLLLLL